MAVFLAAYDIPVSFHTLMRITRRQLDRQRHLGDARRRGREPGVQRRLAERGHRPDDRYRLLGRAAARDDLLGTSSSRSIMLIWVFGWAGGKDLVQTSYAEAKVKGAEQKAARAERKRPRGRRSMPEPTAV